MPNETTEIFVIDDSTVSRKVVEQELAKNKDWQVTSFSDPREALTKLTEKAPDFVVCDLEMPELNGLDLCKVMRKIEDTQNTPFVLLSGNLDDQTIADALRCGVTKTLAKPFAANELLKYVTRSLDKSQDDVSATVLLVDDSKLARKMLTQKLAELKLKVIEASSAEEAETLLAEQPIDLILLDNHMDGKDGMTWCRELRQHPDYKFIPILGLSADTTVSVSFIEAGADDYLAKPYLAEEIRKRVTNLLKGVELTRQLKEALEKARALNHQKNQLLGMAAHDMRNPITSINGLVGLILDGLTEDKEEETELLQRVQTVTKHTQQMLNDMLDVSAIESGVVNLETQALDLATWIPKRLELMNQMGKGKDITGTLDNHLKGKLMVHADAVRLAQVLDNLMSNAIKYSKPGHPFSVILDEKPEGYLISVKDQGQGIPEAELPKLFGEFSKTSVRATGGEKSTGLGLAICKKLVEAHEGSIWAESEPGQGSTFSFVLPKAQS